VILTLQIVLVLTSLLMGLSVLLHKGKGGGLSTLFGGGMQSSLSGSTVVEKNLDRLTIATAVIWVLAVIGLNLALNYGV
jgi:preprotein translocase subunit SecG